mgnify:CR=1 FL=1
MRHNALLALLLLLILLHLVRLYPTLVSSLRYQSARYCLLMRLLLLL